jgi:hypothetical protein
MLPVEHLVQTCGKYRRVWWWIAGNYNEEVVVLDSTDNPFGEHPIMQLA